MPHTETVSHGNAASGRTWLGRPTVTIRPWLISNAVAFTDPAIQIWTFANDNGK